MGTWHNSDGLPVRFGRDIGKRQASSGITRGSVVRTAGAYKEMVIQVDLEGAARTTFTADRNNDGTLDGFEVGLDTPIPSGAKIIGMENIVHETPAGGTTFAVGTYQVDGDAIDADGLAAASATAVGAAGAQVGTKLTEDAYVGIVTVGTYTAGKLTLIIRYIDSPAQTLA
jgi:hypothetical protein